MRLKDLVTIVHNDMDSVILKVKEGMEMNLICLGYFNGDETMFRLTKGKDHTCTVWRKDGSHYDWHWGESGYTCVSFDMETRGNLIEDCIKIDMGINIEGNNIKDTLYTEIPKHRNDCYKVMWWEGESKRVVHKNGEFFKHFKNISEFENMLTEVGYTFTKSEMSRSQQTNCCIVHYSAKI